MNFFNQLPGHVQTPSGFEWVVLKKIPRILLVSTALPCAIMLLLYFSNPSISRDQEQLLFLCIGLLFEAWFFYRHCSHRLRRGGDHEKAGLRS
jgi:hypothetical protein